MPSGATHTQRCLRPPPCPVALPAPQSFQPFLPPCPHALWPPQSFQPFLPPCPVALPAPQSFQLLSKALALPSPAYLDVSHHSELRDADLVLLLSKCGRTLRHLVARGTQLGPHCLAMLAANVSRLPPWCCSRPQTDTVLCCPAC